MRPNGDDGYEGDGATNWPGVLVGVCLVLGAGAFGDYLHEHAPWAQWLLGGVFIGWLVTFIWRSS